MANLINTAITGLKSSQLGLSITGQNIVNANTDGYSRQTVHYQTTATVFKGAGYVGSGVTISGIIRNTEDYLVKQLATDTSLASDFDTFLENISQVDTLLANPDTSLATTLDDFFAALNESVNDPSSIEGRQLLLTQSRLLVNSFRSMDTRLLEQASGINQQFISIAEGVSALGAEIAALNHAISNSPGVAEGKFPNDLLDKRDESIRRLSELVDVRVIDKEFATVDVFIGQGQGLVIGSSSAKLVSEASPADPTRYDLFLDFGSSKLNVTDKLTGGEIGALERFRNEALSPARNALGRISLALADGMNEIQRLGIDLEGNIGKLFFTDINDPSFTGIRVKKSINNPSPNNGVLAVNITSIGDLSTSDYELNFPGPAKNFTLTRKSDREIIVQGVLSDKLPDVIEAEGFSIEFKSGTFQKGDTFIIEPTKSGTRSFNVRLDRPEEIAFASPIVTETNTGNLGNALIVPGSVESIDTNFFDASTGALNPPIMIRFNSPTNYDVLDYTDPANPIPLEPPLSNQSYTPGVRLEVFPEDPGGTTVSTNGGSQALANIGASGNGYQEEVIRIQTLDEKTGFVKKQEITTEQNQSAREIANDLSALDGVKATASSQLQLSQFTSGTTDIPLRILLNGVDLTDPTFKLPGEPLPSPIPDPPNADFLRDRINAIAELQNQGIYARSDGEILTVKSTFGVDLNVEVGGNTSDSLVLRDGDLRTVTGRTDTSGGVSIPIGSKFDIDLGFGPTTVDLAPQVIDFRDVVNVIQRDVDLALGQGVVKVSQNPAGGIVFSAEDKTRVVTISNVDANDVLGIEPIRLTGPDQGNQPATLSNGSTAASPLNFSALNGSFTLVADGSTTQIITLASNYPVNSQQAIVDNIQAQINAGILSGLVTVSLDASNSLVFRSTSTGPTASLIATGVTDMQGLVNNGSAVGFQTSGTRAVLTGNVSAVAGANFNQSGPHSFDLSVDGSDPVRVNLIGDTGSPAVYEGDVDASAGVDFTVGGPHEFTLSLSGQPPVIITLDEDTVIADPFATLAVDGKNGIVTHMQEKIDAAVGPDVATVDIDPATGFISISTVQTGTSATVGVGSLTNMGAVFTLPSSVQGNDAGLAGVVNLIQSAVDGALSPWSLGPVTVGADLNGNITFSSPSYGLNSTIEISNVTTSTGYIFPGSAQGIGLTNNAVVGGTIDVQLETGATLSSNTKSGLFSPAPKAKSNYTGFQVAIESGQGIDSGPKQGDTFFIRYNANGSADNRNGIAMLDLNTDTIVSNGNLTLQGAYGQLVEEVGVLASQARINRDASQSLLRQSSEALQASAGVNLDEEAARLIVLEQHYNASAQVISIARQLFDVLLDL